MMKNFLFYLLDSIFFTSYQNFSNSSSWQASEEDLDDFDTDINLKPVQTGGSSLNDSKRHLNSTKKLIFKRKFTILFLIQFDFLY